MGNRTLLRTSRLVSILIIAGLVWAALPSVTAFAQEAGVPTAVVTVDYLPVRQAPTLVTGTIAQLSRGQTVELTGYRTWDSQWVQVTLPGIEAGWVAANAVKTRFPVANLTVLGDAQGDARSQGGAATVTATYAPVRNGLGPTRFIIAQLARGERVELPGFRTADARWIQVALSNGRLGWVEADAILSDFPLSGLTAIDGLYQAMSGRPLTFALAQ